MENDELEQYYSKFLSGVERAFNNTEMSAEHMIARIYCGLKFSEGSIRAMKIFSMMGAPVMGKVEKQYLIEWLEGIIEDLRN